MGPGDAVIVLADPWLHGAGLFDQVLDTERILVVFMGDREEVFNAFELELLDVWIGRELDRMYAWLEALLAATA